MDTLPDATTTETHLTLMTRKRAFWLFFISLIFTGLFAVTSFVPPNTKQWTMRAPAPPTAVTKLNFRDKITDVGPLSSFLVLQFMPAIFPSSVPHEVTIEITGLIQFLNEDSAQLYNKTISQKYKVQSDASEPKIVFFERSFIDFSQIYITIDFTTTNQELTEIYVLGTSLSRELPITAIVMISFATALVVFMLVFLVSKRVRPAKADQWMTVFMSGALILVDGPWLVCSYYALPAFAQVFDAMSQLFHAFFIIYVFVFFSVRAAPPANLIFKNPIINIASMLCSVLLLILQFSNTDLMPLTTFNIISKSGALFATTCAFFAIYHTVLLGAFFYGFTQLNIERFFSLLLVMFMFAALELIQIFTFIIRLVVGRHQIGVSAAMDIFYILMANIVTFFLLYTNTPVARSTDNVSLFLMNSHDDPGQETEPEPEPAEATT